MFQNVFDDVRFGARLLRKNPILSATTVLMFTIGIGLDAGVFTVIDGLLFRPRVASDPASFVELRVDIADDRGRTAADVVLRPRESAATASGRSPKYGATFEGHMVGGVHNSVDRRGPPAALVRVTVYGVVGEFCGGRRFDTKQQALPWAELEREALE
jgi:hypothetical protein